MADLAKDAALFLQETARMCDTFEYCEGCGVGTSNCSLHMSRTREEIMNLIKTVQEWHDANPRNTYAGDFFKKFPNAPKKGGHPRVCIVDCYGATYTGRDCRGREYCAECWEQEMEIADET